MERLLVAGVDTVVGANIAAQVSEKYQVVGLSAAATVSIDGCETAVLATDDPAAIRDVIENYRPDRVAFCAVAGDSPWHRAGSHIAEPGAVAAARNWSRVVGELKLPYTLIASDALFTGPWMFHTESSTSFCGSATARILRLLEGATLANCPKALLVRTHAYGWSPLADGMGWIEGILAALESDRQGIFDCMAHATPILATDLADVLHRGWQADLTGTYHVAGAERVNPHRFVRTLASVFELTPPEATILAPPDVPPAAFAQGETSLHTRSIRQALGIAMPMLLDGLQRLREHQTAGFDRRFRGSRRLVPSNVA